MAIFKIALLVVFPHFMIECHIASSFYHIFTYSLWRAFTALYSFYFHLEYHLKNISYSYLLHL